MSVNWQKKVRASTQIKAQLKGFFSLIGSLGTFINIFIVIVKIHNRFYNDYERYNLTHFKSNYAKNWWTNNHEAQKMTFRSYYLDFRAAVSCDGYKKLKNLRLSDDSSTCICIGTISIYLLVAKRIKSKAFNEIFAKFKDDSKRGLWFWLFSWFWACSVHF